MSETVKFHPAVVEQDLPKIDARTRSQIFAAIEHRLVQGTPIYGKPLQKSLKGCRRIRMGNYRIVYKFYEETKIILIVAIRHRSEVYDYAQSRI